jgi:HK97 family phage portal protein
MAVPAARQANPVNKSGMSLDDWWAEFGPTSKSAGGMSITQITAMQVSTVLACVTIRAEDVAKLPVHVYRRMPNGGKEIVTDHEIERVLQMPNADQSAFEFLEQMHVALMLRGNAYAVILRDWRGQVISLIPVNPDRVWIYEAPGGELFYQVARRGMHEMAVLANEPLMIPSDDILHLRGMAIDNSLYGMSRIALAREAIGLALSQQELAGRLSANNTNLGGVLTTDKKLSREAAERLAKSWKERKQGLRNAGEVAVLEEGVKWQALGMTARDAEFIASRNMQVQEIARIFRMPLHKLGITGESRGASIEQMDQDYMNSVVSSDLGRWEGKISQTFGLAAQGLFVEFDVSGFLRASIGTRYQSYRTGIVGMFLTPNEARRAEGLPDHPEGNTLYQPTNVAPIGWEPTGSETGPGSDVTGQPAPGGRGDPAAVSDDSAPTD